MVRKLAERDEYKEEKDDNIDDYTKEVEINKNGDIVETDNEKIVVDAANDAPSPQDSLTTTKTTAAVAKEGGDDDYVGAEDRNNNDGADDTKGGGEGRGDPAVEDGNDKYDGDEDEKYNNKEDVMDVLPPLVSCRVERLKRLNTERERG